MVAGSGLLANSRQKYRKRVALKPVVRGLRVQVCNMATILVVFIILLSGINPVRQTLLGR